MCTWLGSLPFQTVESIHLGTCLGIRALHSSNVNDYLGTYPVVGTCYCEVDQILFTLYVHCDKHVINFILINEVISI